MTKEQIEALTIEQVSDLITELFERIHVLNKMPGDAGGFAAALWDEVDQIINDTF